MWKRNHFTKEELREKSKNWFSRPGEKEKQRMRLRANKSKVVWYYTHGSYRCSCCGYYGLLFMSVDHINNDGQTQRAKNNQFKGGNQYSKIISLGFPYDIQILCYNCNFAKGWSKDKICPHVKDV